LIHALRCKFQSTDSLCETMMLIVLIHGPLLASAYLRPRVMIRCTGLRRSSWLFSAIATQLVTYPCGADRSGVWTAPVLCSGPQRKVV
jgi:hypothetical protein